MRSNGWSHARDASLALMCVVSCLIAAAAGVAAEAPGASARAVTGAAPPAREPRAREFVTRHRGRFNGRAVTYTATAGETVLPNAEGRPAATMFAFSYVEDGADPAHRPVMFVFNGGPGSSSVWMHMGAFGPWRVDFPPGAPRTTAAPYPLVPNDVSLLDVTDLVFIDPVGTGFSRVLEGGKESDYFGMNEDAAAFGSFIRGWLTRNQRWNSPKFLAGESYGSMRAALLARELMGGVSAGSMNGTTLNGIVLLGQAVDMTATTPTPGNDMAYSLVLPSMAAVAWHQGRIEKAGRTFDALIEEAKRFAATEYPAALFQGSGLAPEARAAIARRLSGLTGLSEELIMKEDLRVTARKFAAELLASDGRVVGMYDGRYSTPTPRVAPDAVGDDPSLAQVAPAVTVALNDYMTRVLNVRIDDEYEIINFRLNAKWNWKLDSGPTFYFNLAPQLAAAMRQNPGLRLFVASGYFDLTTPFFSAEHMASHSSLPFDRVRLAVYESGHMPYVGASGLRGLNSDVRGFIGEATRAP